MSQPAPKKRKLVSQSVSWKAPARPYKKRNREYYTTIASITFLLGVILLLMKEFLLIGVVVALAFLSYVLASIPPQKVEHKVGHQGVETDGQLYPWDQLLYYWTDKKWGFEILYLKTEKPIPGQLILVLDPREKGKVIKVVDEYLEMMRPQPSWVDKASRWLQEKVPLEA